MHSKADQRQGPRARSGAVPVTVPMRYIRGMVDAGVRGGARRDDLLAAAGGISGEMLLAPRARVSLTQFSRLYGTVAQRLHDESAGLSAEAIPLGAVETIIRTGMTAGSLSDGVDVVAKCLNSMQGATRTAACRTADEISIVLTPGRQGGAEVHHTYEVVLLTVYAALTWLFGQRLPLLSVDFPSPVPRHLFELRTLFAGVPRFNQPQAALRFPAQHGGLRVVREPAAIAKFLRRAPASLIEILLVRGGLAMQLRRIIQESLPEVPPVREMADRLALSPRSLHRRLAAEGESFQKIKDDLRRDMGIHALTRTAAPLKQIAIDLGFADQASFQRAFLHWTGQSPGHWRRMAARRLPG